MVNERFEIRKEKEFIKQLSGLGVKPTVAKLNGIKELLKKERENPELSEAVLDAGAAIVDCLHDFSGNPKTRLIYTDIRRMMEEIVRDRRNAAKS
ncbi:MAG: hypothetical protein KGH49_03085 [Candidatus Micrarchaeota archaeon]|nr:hypothetical protein [Candidatus Micrarchaeota archaeon]